MHGWVIQKRNTVKNKQKILSTLVIKKLDLK